MTTSADIAPELERLREEVRKLSEQADQTLVAVDKLKLVCEAIDDVRNVQQGLRQALTLVLDHLDKIAPQP